MMYSDKLVDHYTNPRNVGSLNRDSENVGTGFAGTLECGDMTRLQIQIDQDNRIVDAKFKTFGCCSAIASSSLATEWVKGRTLNEALKIRNTEIADELSLSPVKAHCSVLAEDAVRAAVHDLQRKRAAAKPEKMVQPESHDAERDRGR